MSPNLKAADWHLVGVVSDTHGLVRPEVLKVLEGTELIVHAGDIGMADVLRAFRTIAPVVAVRGNVDNGRWARALHKTAVVEVDGTILYVIHDLGELDLDPVAEGLSVIISGHSHRPSLAKRKGVLYVNPGSAGVCRFTSPVSVALISIKKGTVETKLVKIPT
ncbi:MAG: YfcE family phosphodiesterase [Proteobacteria bacterium]|nr:YfcE family phosphodiesterase [Pseudomonadota bacterium]